jgi:hypothetical protein
MFVAPLAGWRHVAVADHHAKRDWANMMRELAEVHFPNAPKIRVVLDNLTTHRPEVFCEFFEPEVAKRLLDRFEFHYTPKHGSWLNMAEIEFSALFRECLDRRIGERQALIEHVAAWETDRNVRGAAIDWRFTTGDARIKLKRLYPSINT